MKNFMIRLMSAGDQFRTAWLFVRTVLCVALLSALLPSCKKQLDIPQGNFTLKPVLSISSDSVVLQRADSLNTAVSFKWNAGAVKGLTGTLTYIIEIDQKGGNFSHPTQILVKGDSVSRPVTTKELILLFGSLPTNTPNQMEARLVTATSDGSASPVISNTVYWSLTTYPASPYSQLWLIGDATPGGWSLNAMTPMVESITNPFVFTYSGTFVPGEFKIATAADFNAPFFKPTVNHPDLSATSVQLSAGNPDNKWIITAADAGNYQITLNIQTNTISIVSLDIPAYSQLWLVGDATPGGWDLNSLTPMVRSSTDPFTFTYTGTFTSGEFKVATAADWSAPFYRPLTNHPDLSVTTVGLWASDSTHPDNKWYITNAGTYTVTLSIRGNGNITIVKQ